MFHVESSSHKWQDVTTNYHVIADEYGMQYAQIITTSENPMPQIETMGGLVPRSPKQVIEYTQALMEAVKFYDQLLAELNSNNKSDDVPSMVVILHENDF